MTDRSELGQLGQPRHEYRRIGEDEQRADELATPNVVDPSTVVVVDDTQDLHRSAKLIERNFRWMSILFAANHASVVACLSLATARFAAVGAWQSGILYITYVASALFGATGLVKQLGGRNALVAGMSLYCVYVAAFLVATINPANQQLFAYIGAAIGGIGAGFLWTAQGAYFAVAAGEHSRALRQSLEQSTNKFSSIFAFYYLVEEVILRAISSLSGSTHVINWTVIFAIYVLVAVVSTFGMLGIRTFDKRSSPLSSSPLTDPAVADSDADAVVDRTTAAPRESWLSRSTAALQLLYYDPKMKYMIGLNSVFGFSASFLGSYVNGEVTKVVFGNANMVGLLTAWLSIVAAFMSTVFERVANLYGKASVLIAGSICFAFVAIPFVVFPTIENWTPVLLIFVYTMHGTGRATFEGTLKAVFADLFHFEKEGAFANIILQNGSASAIGYALSFGLVCQEGTSYCERFSDGSLHDVRTFEWLVIATSIMAILGFLRASHLHQRGLSTTVEQDSAAAI